MRWPLPLVSATVFLSLGCGGPGAPMPAARGSGGNGGVGDESSGGMTQHSTAGGTDGRGGSGTGGTISTYVEPSCPNTVTPEVDAQCDVLDQSTCPEGEACYPTISYPSAPCEPEIYRMLCLPAGQGLQWEDCSALTDCAPGFICVVGGTGTQCQSACDASAPTSCPKGLFCDAIDLQGIGTCY